MGHGVAIKVSIWRWSMAVVLVLLLLTHTPCFKCVSSQTTSVAWGIGWFVTCLVVEAVLVEPRLGRCSVPTVHNLG